MQPVVRIEALVKVVLHVLSDDSLRFLKDMLDPIQGFVAFIDQGQGISEPKDGHWTQQWQWDAHAQTTGLKLNHVV